MSKLVGPIGRMAPRAVLNSLSRTGVAVAALMIAVSVSIGVSLMVDSFRYTVEEWLTQVLTGDVYISAPGVSAVDASAPIDPEVVDLLGALDWVERADALRTTTVRGVDGEVNLLAVDDPEFGARPLIWRRAARDEIWAQMQAGSVAVSEPFANRFNLPADATSVILQTPEGPMRFPIVGIYTDYGSSEGNVSMALAVYQELWDDEAITGLALQLSPGEDVGARSAQLADQLAPIQGLLVQPHASLRAEALRIFDRTFAITAALRMLALIVAFIGVLSAMLSLQLEKGREYGVLKALGLTGRQLWTLISLETGLMGGVAGVLSMPTGLALAAILVHIINRRFFGWTLQMKISLEPFLWAFVIAVGAAVLAGIYPSLRLRRMAPAEALRYE
jgi:putative ABC transport system permease protein